MKHVTKKAGRLRSARSWGALGLVLALITLVTIGSEQTPPCVTPPSGMVAWWPLDETAGNTTVIDLVGGHTGVPVSAPVGSGGPSPVAGMVSGALYFSSSSTYVRVPNSPALNFGTGDFAIEAWVNPVQVGPTWYQPIVDKTEPVSGGSGFKGYRLYIKNGSLVFELSDGSTIAGHSLSVPYGSWTLVYAARAGGIIWLVTFNSGAGVISNSGLLVAPVDVNNNGDLLIGGITAFGFLTQPGIGEVAIDELEIFNRELTWNEFWAIAIAGPAGKCKPQQGRICVLKFEDLNGNGVQDATEPLLPGWQFTVTDQNNNPMGTITTPPPGIPPACVTVPAPGTYTVTEQSQMGWTPTTPTSQTVTVQPGQTVNVFFGNKREEGKAEICIVKFEDKNGNGKQDPGEPGLGGWQFTVNPAPLPPAISPVTTLPNGSICFGVSAPGTYTITEIVQSGWTPTTPTTQTITVAPGQLVNLFFGNQKKQEEEPTADLGDAPDSTNHFGFKMDAYSGVPARFPTVYDPATGLPPGPKHLAPKGLAWLGKDVSFEDEADVPPDQDGVTNIDPSANLANRDGFDDGVALPVAIPLNCGYTQFKYTVTSTVATRLYVNVWIDFNRDGDWEDAFKCALGPAIDGLVREWAVQNEVISVVPGLNTFTTPPFLAANPTKGADMWMRVTLTDQPIGPAQGADGSGPVGGYKYGETEDYLLRLTYAEICGVKFHDLNGNGKQDAGEPGLASWLIEVKDASGNLVSWALTDENGRYCITVPAPGTYTVAEQVQPGWTPTTPPAVTVTIPPAASNVNFGNRREVGKAQICIVKFEDKNGNGRPDAGEPGLTGWVFLVTPVGPGDYITKNFTTGEDGRVCFEVDAPGTYVIAEDVPPGWTATTPVTQTVTAQPGETVTVYFGNQLEAGRCDLAIRKVPSATSVATGQQITYTITVTNMGTAACPGPTTVTETVPAGLSLVSASGLGWLCIGNVCTYLLPIPAGGSASVTFTFNVTAPAGTVIENCATVANPNDTNQANNRACATVQVTGRPVGTPIGPGLPIGPGAPDLALRKLLEGELRANQEAVYVLQVANVGNASTTGPIQVVDTLPSQLSFVSASGTGWTYTVMGQTITATYLGALAPGSTATLAIKVKVLAQPGTQVTNCATVTAPGDNNPANNQGCHTSTVMR